MTALQYLHTACSDLLARVLLLNPYYKQHDYVVNLIKPYETYIYGYEHKSKIDLKKWF